MSPPLHRPITLDELIAAAQATLMAVKGPAYSSWLAFVETLEQLRLSGSAQAMPTGAGESTDPAAGPNPPVPNAAASSPDAATMPCTHTPGGGMAGVLDLYPLPWRVEQTPQATYIRAANGNRVHGGPFFRHGEIIVACVNAVGGDPARVDEVLAANSRLVEDKRGLGIALKNAIIKIDALVNVIALQRTGVQAARPKVDAAPSAQAAD